jgi:uncharacterized protein
MCSSPIFPPTILDLATALAHVKSVTGVNLSLYEADRQTETVKATIQGESIDYPGIELMS